MNSGKLISRQDLHTHQPAIDHSHLNIVRWVGSMHGIYASPPKSLKVELLGNDHEVITCALDSAHTELAQRFEFS